VATLRHHVERIGRTLREMTDFARRRGDESTAITVGNAVEDALRMVRHDPRARRIVFTTDIPPDLSEVRMVEDQLVMVLVNLMINAFDAMPEGGALVVRGEPAGRSHVRISVTDTGTGMSEEVLRRATEPLFTTKAGGRGTGLGLSISADVLHAAGGSLDIESRPAHGTTVHLTCPTVTHA
jgi:two-component system NtrC family sensor kinase